MNKRFQKIINDLEDACEKLSRRDYERLIFRLGMWLDESRRGYGFTMEWTKE